MTTAWVIEQQRPPYDHEPRNRLEEIEPELLYAQFEGGKTNMTVKHPIVPIIARGLADYYKAISPINFVELTFQDLRDNAEYTLTMASTIRPTPSEITAKLRAALELILGYSSTLEGAHIAAELALQDCGYLPKKATKNE